MLQNTGGKKSEPELPDDIIPDDGVIHYKILEKGSKRGGRLLIASNGYTFGVEQVIQSMDLQPSIGKTVLPCNS
uniref:Uncharacterized protein n=1 Tax=Magallana gigas TaxID=29159 RepID=A0A8W8JLL0_MAGGI